MLSLAQRKRKQRYIESRYAAAIAAPGGSPFVVTETGQFAVRHAAGAIANSSTLVVTGPTTRTLGTPALVAGHVYHIGRLERASSVAIDAGYELLLDCGLGIYRIVAEG
jgi:hypothetical protein